MPGSATTTRRKRTAQGKCSVCLDRRASAGHPTCRTCRQRIAERSAEVYRERRAAGLCVRCGLPSGGTMLCEPHAEERRERRQARGWR